MTTIPRRRTQPLASRSPAAEDGEGLRHVLQALDHFGLHHVPNAHGYMAQCPAHEDSNPSLSVKDADGRVLLHCFAGCAFHDVLEALELELEDLFDGELVSSEPATPATYTYTAADGTPTFRVVRGRNKAFHVEHRDRRGRCWNPGRGKAHPVLYNLPAVLDAVTDHQRVYVVEGERDADSLIRLGLTATTNPGGAGKWLDIHSQALAGAEVVVIADNDEPGRRHAEKVQLALVDHGCTVQVKRAAVGKDVTDHLAAGHSLDALLPLEVDSGQRRGLAFDPTLVLNVEQLWDLPKIQPLVDDLLDRGDLAMAFGLWSSGKSLFALDVALSVASAHPWHGRTVHAGPVLYVAAEAMKGIPQRIEAWLEYYALPDPNHLFIYPRPVNLLDPEAGAQVGAFAREIGAVLVVFDTLGKCIPGAEENSARDMGAVLFQLEEIQRTCRDCTVLYVHHTDKNGKAARGSGVLSANAEVTLQLREIKTGGFTLENPKRREHKRTDRMQFRLAPCADFVVPVQTEVQIDEDDTFSPAHQRVLDALDEAGAGGMLQRDLVEQLEVAASTMSGLLGDLEKLGLVRRHQEAKSKRCWIVD